VTTAQVDLRPITFQDTTTGAVHSSVVATLNLFDSDGKFLHGHQNTSNLDYTKEQLAAALSSGLNLKSEFDAKPGHYLVRWSCAMSNSKCQLPARPWTFQEHAIGEPEANARVEFKSR
jgi:hypothetical protein